MASIFFDLAGEARGLRPTRVRSLQAGVFSGTQAAKLGLTDGVMSLDRVALALSKGGRQPRAVGVMLNGARAAGPTAGTSAKMGAYSEDQPRDEDGKFGEGGAGHDEHEHEHEHHEHEHHEEKKEEKKDLHVSATRLQWSQRPGRESLRKKLGPAKSFAIEERGGHKCAYCKTPQPKIPPARPLDNHQFDHIIPRVEGGKDHESNLVLACKRCNSARHTMSLTAWRTYAKDKYGVDFSIKAVHEQAARSIDKFLDLFRKRKKS
jgi:5-methylcytosine-specific restriction endonuclease McrA